MKIKVQKLHPDAQLPIYATDGSAAFDLLAHTVDGCRHIGKHVTDNGPLTCGTGLAFQIPADHVMLIFSRSGHGFKNGVRLSNCVGVIDSDYTGEVMVQLTQDARLDNTIDDLAETWINPGARIAQAIVIPRPKCTFELVDELTPTARANGGFGSTGD